MQARHILQLKLDDTTRQIHRLESGLSEKPKQGLGRGAALISNWELNQALLARLKHQAASLRDALSRIEQGTYGVCEQCGRSVHTDRLAVLPETRLCIECARASASGESRGRL
jgi:RNA polymerase-binding transcription factor DksA